eukprot:5728801-Pyramimonas_sp.AAC.1
MTTELGRMRQATYSYNTRAEALEASLIAFSAQQAQTYQGVQTMINGVSNAWEDRFTNLERRFEETLAFTDCDDEAMEDPSKFG